MRAQTTSILLSAFLLWGCATAPSLRPIPAGEEVTISVVASPKYPGMVDVYHTALSDGLSTGIGSGFLAGGLWGLSCGPWAALCIPLGAAGGLVVGGAAGAAVGFTGVLPQEKIDRIKARLARLEQSAPLLVHLKRNLEDRAQKHWTLNSEPAPTLVSVELQELKVYATRDEQLRFVVRVVVSQRDVASNREPGRNQKVYEYATPFGSINAWLDEQSDLLDISFASASQQLAAQVIADLATCPLPADQKQKCLH